VGHVAGVELAGGVGPLKKAGHDVGGFLRKLVVDVVAVEESSVALAA
jgi:hypothetical protein